MINTNRQDSPASETFIVASGNQALVVSGSMFPSSGNSIGLANGQLGIVCDDNTSHLGVGDYLSSTNDVAGTGANTATSVKKIKLIQGTEYSSDLSVMDNSTIAAGKRPFIATNSISGKSPITFVGRAYATPTRSAFLIGNVTSGTDKIPANDSTNYSLKIECDSRRRNKVFGTKSRDVVNVNVETPVFSTISLSTAAQKTDWVIQNLVYKANLNSKLTAYNPNAQIGNKPFIAFAIDLDGSGTGTALSAIAAGTPFNYMVRDGVTLSYTPDAQFVATIAAAIASSTPLVNATEIGVVNLTTGGAQTHDAILIVALDEDKALVTDLDNTDKVRLVISMNEALYGSAKTTRLEEVNYASEGEGQARFYNLQYIDRAGAMIHKREWFGSTLDFLPNINYINPAITYNVYIIEHRNDNYTNYSHINQNPEKIVLLIPSTASTTIANLNAILAPWILSATVETVSSFATLPSLF